MALSYSSLHLAAPTYCSFAFTSDVSAHRALEISSSVRFFCLFRCELKGFRAYKMSPHTDPWLTKAPGSCHRRVLQHLSLAVFLKAHNTGLNILRGAHEPQNHAENIL